MQDSKLSQDIQSLFEAYSMDDLRYKEVTEQEKYQSVKQKWQGLAASKHAVGLNVLNAPMEDGQINQPSKINQPSNKAGDK